VRTPLVFLIGALAVALAAPGLAKEGVVAHLENPFTLLGPGGKRITLVWTLRADKEPFGASGIYIRLRARSGTTTVREATEIGPGRFRARFVIPRGGVAGIAIGLRGWASDARGTRHADVFFPIANDPTRR
jgi:hypothetical protein